MAMMMPKIEQFSVYHNKSLNRQLFPLLLTVQCNMFRNFSTATILPLMLASRLTVPLIPRLNLTFDIDCMRYVVITQHIFTIERQYLGERLVDMSDNANAIIGAVDYLLLGY
jgi:hypothetical protein